MNAGDVTIELVARMVHEAQRAWDQILGDASLLPWADLLEEDRRTLIDRVQASLGARTPPLPRQQGWRDLTVEQRVREGLVGGVVRAFTAAVAPERIQEPVEPKPDAVEPLSV